MNIDNSNAELLRDSVNSTIAYIDHSVLEVLNDMNAQLENINGKEIKASFVFAAIGALKQYEELGDDLTCWAMVMPEEEAA